VEETPRCPGHTPAGCKVYPTVNGKCYYHYALRESIASPGFQGFLDWIEELNNSRVCHMWTHHDAGALFDAVLGKDAMPGAERACRSPRCLYLAASER